MGNDSSCLCLCLCMYMWAGGGSPLSVDTQVVGGKVWECMVRGVVGSYASFAGGQCPIFIVRDSTAELNCCSFMMCCIVLGLWSVIR